MKTDWQRSTRVCPTIDLQPDLLMAIRAHVEMAELGLVETQTLVCFETISRRTKRGGLLERLGGVGHKTLTQAVIVTPTRLAWAQRADDGEAGAYSELLARPDVSDYEKSPAASPMPDHGLEVLGIVAMAGHVGSLFFGLGEGPDADHAWRVFEDAVRAAHGEGPPASPQESSASQPGTA